jgi:hypothetical protein
VKLSTACLILFLTATAPAADKSLWADADVAFPFYPDARGGGTAAMGKSTFELIPGDGPAGFSGLRLAGSQEPVQGAWWYPGHRALTEEQAMIGNPDARVLLNVRSAKPVKGEVSVAWRVNGDSAEPSRSETLAFGPDKTTEVLLPIPKLAPGAKINGLVIIFSKAGTYDLSKIALARAATIEVDPIEPGVLRLKNRQTITGRTVEGVSRVSFRFAPEKEPYVQEAGPMIEKTVEVKAGRFQFDVTADQIPPGHAYKVSAAPAGQPDAASPARRLFVFPALTGKQNPPVTRQGADLVADGKRFGFIGVNYTRFNLGLSVEADYEALAHDVIQMKNWGVRVVRVTASIALTQPKPGVFPDSPDYAEIVKSYKLDPRYWDQFDYFIQLAGEHGIYVVIDWHQMPLDPYNYFMGGKPSKRDSGEPGTAIAYLAESPTKAASNFHMDNPLHLKTLLDSHRWVAKHLKGNPNVLAMEVPFNEPHAKHMAIEANWRKVTDLCAKAVHEGDPDRMTFVLGPSYSHNNVLASVTWLLPDRVTGAAPHFYQANGPVPVRADAKKFRSPWLARENEGTFGWSFPAVMLPQSAAQYPIYNGETGAHGHDQVLPDHPDSARILVEAQLFQEYYTGMAGRLEWTLWGYEKEFGPYAAMYEQQFKRYSPVYRAGPIDRMKAQVAFVQNTDAADNGNGHNFSCVPLAKAALDVHLNPVHYLTDAQFRFYASAEMSVGLEQVVEASENLQYKAYIVDKRELDKKVEKQLAAMGVPVLWLDDAKDLTAEKLAEFLTSAGIATDTKTPKEIQLAEGPEHVVVYRRLKGEAPEQCRIYPLLKDKPGDFELVNEAGQSVFKGNAQSLAEQGLEINLPLWKSMILKVVAK